VLMASEPNVITAAVGIFSGRPNPEITLSGTDATTLTQRLREARGKESPHPPPQAKLGFYYGFQVSAPKQLASKLEIPEAFNVFAGVITQQSGREQNHWRDVSGVEDFLLAIAYARDLGEWLDRVNAPRPVATKGSVGVEGPA
jgi:hypothetical protein